MGPGLALIMGQAYTEAPLAEQIPKVRAQVVVVIDNQVDQTTGTIKLKGTFANEDRRLWPGPFLNVVVTLTSDPMAIVVPTAAVQAGQQGPYVFIVKDDRTVDMRPVVVSRTTATESVIGSGLQPGETVVTDGHLRLVPGSHISVKTQGRAAEPVAPATQKGTS